MIAHVLSRIFPAGIAHQIELTDFHARGFFRVRLSLVSWVAR
jgi:hypothetical protein